MVERTVTTNGTGRRDAAPEQAHVEITAEGGGESPGTARRQATDLGATVLDALPGDLGRTTGIRADEEVFEDDKPPYTATQTIEVTCTPDEASDVVVAATDEGASVRDVTFGLTDPTAERLHDEALIDAMADARRKAAQLAAAEGMAVGSVREVTTVDPSGMYSLVESALDAGPGDDFEFHPGPVDVLAEVEVVYDLESESETQRSA